MKKILVPFILLAISVAALGGSGVSREQSSVWTSSGNVGIGTLSPATPLDISISTTSATQPVQITGYGANNVGFRSRHAQGTLTSPTQTLSGDTLGFFGGRGYGSTGFGSTSTGAFNILSTANFTDTSMPTALTFFVTPNSSVTSAEAMRIAPSGDLLVGTTTDATGKLQVNGSVYSSGFNDSGLTASSTVFTDASKNLTSTGTVAIANGGTGSATASANTFFAGPTSGSAAAPSFRALNTLDGPMGPAFYFGDGSSGALNCTGSITLTSDVFYTSATFGSGCALNTAGYRIFANGTCDFSAAPTGAVFNNGGNGGAGSASGTAGTAGLVTGLGSFLSQNSTTAGAAGSTTTGSSATANGQIAGCLGGNTAAGGSGGQGTSGNTGGNGGGAGTATNGMSFGRFTVDFFRPGTGTTAAFYYTGTRGGGGGGGGGDATISGAGGGGAAGMGGGIWISCNTIARGTNSNTSIIQAKGGTGGAGGSPTTSTLGTGGGGGGVGGAGGYVFISAFSFTGSSITNAIDVSGGAGGVGGNGHGTSGAGGNGGGSGGGGRADVLNIGSLTGTHTVPTSPNSGGAASGATGGSAGGAVTLRANL